jgi:Immunity protein 8
VTDLSVWRPAGEDFAVLLQLMVGPQDAAGEEAFSLTVCTAGWLARRAVEEGVVDGRHHLVVARYDWPLIERFIRRRVTAVTGDDWKAIAVKLGRFGQWEFEDYHG